MLFYFGSRYFPLLLISSHNYPALPPVIILFPLSMCELVGLNVVGLKRVRIGRITLSKLPPGNWRYLGEHEKF